MENYFAKIIEYFHYRFDKVDGEINELRIEDKQDEEDERNLFEATARLSDKLERIERLVHQLIRKLGTRND